VIEAIEIGDLRSDRPIAEKLSPENFGLLQQNLPQAAVSTCSKHASVATLLNHLIRTGE
jgi:hypothetical protein